MKRTTVATWLCVVCVASAAGCAKSANTRLEHADDAAETAKEKDEDARKAQHEAEKAKTDANEAHDDAVEAVRKERADYTKRIRKEIADADAKLSPDPNAKGKAQLQPAERQALQQRRAMLDQDLGVVGTGTDHEWPQIKARLDKDLDAK